LDSSQSINQSINQLINQSIKESINQSVTRRESKAESYGAQKIWRKVPEVTHGRGERNESSIHGVPSKRKTACPDHYRDVISTWT
jgi:hypothetical protein